MPDNWQANLIDTADGIATLLRECRRLAIVGIKTEAQSGQPAFYVPEYLKRVGYQVVPVPVYFPEATQILGEKVFRSVAAIPDPVDMVVLFRRSKDVPPHVPDLIAAHPRAVWMQTGIRHDEAARELAQAGIQVVQDRCTMVEHRRIR